MDTILLTLLTANQLTSLYFIPAIPVSLKEYAIWCALMPFVEELVFRMFVPKILTDLGMGTSNETTTVIFALVHLTNPLFIQGMGWKIVLYQFYNTLVAGYYFARLDNIYLAIICHILFNSIIFAGSAMKYKLQKHDSQVNTFEECQECDCCEKQFDAVSNEFGRSNSCSNLSDFEDSDDDYNGMECKSLPKSAKELKTSFQRFDDKMDKLNFAIKEYL